MKPPLVPLLGFFMASLAIGAGAPPNVVVIFADDLGYADIAGYGPPAGATPHLDRLAREGTRFTQFYVPHPVCSASRAALLTGCYAPRVGIRGALMPGSTASLPASTLTLPELLKSRGYATGMAGKWHLGDSPAASPLAHGFDEFLGLPYSNDMWPPKSTARQAYPPLPLLEGERLLRTLDTLGDQESLTTLYTERAVGFIERHRDRPFFFYLAHSMPHVPLAVSDRFKGRTGRGRYADVIAELDWSVGEVLAALERHGLEERTLVLFTSDNGPWRVFGNHGGSAGPFREGKLTTFEGGVRVPCILRGPGIPAGRVSDTVWMTIDLLPTLARVTGSALPAAPLDGRDVWPVLTQVPGARHPREGYGLFSVDNQLQAVVSADGRWKLRLPHTYPSVVEPGRDGAGGKTERRRIETIELNDLKEDPGETTNRAAAHPEVVARLRRLAERLSADVAVDAASASSPPAPRS